MKNYWLAIIKIHFAWSHMCDGWWSLRFCQLCIIIFALYFTIAYKLYSFHCHWYCEEIYEIVKDFFYLKNSRREFIDSIVYLEYNWIVNHARIMHFECLLLSEYNSLNSTNWFYSNIHFVAMSFHRKWILFSILETLYNLILEVTQLAHHRRKGHMHETRSLHIIRSIYGTVLEMTLLCW